MHYRLFVIVIYLVRRFSHIIWTIQEMSVPHVAYQQLGYRFGTSSDGYVQWIVPSFIAYVHFRTGILQQFHALGVMAANGT